MRVKAYTAHGGA